MNNKATISGKINSVEFSHEFAGEKFYLVNISAERLSGSIDNIQVIVSEREINITNDDIGNFVEISGQFRSHNICDGEKKKLCLFVFAEEILFCSQDSKKNEIEIDGFICKEPTFRQTPLGRQISDVMLAVNRSYGKTDYIPCVVWGRNAKYASKLNMGDFVHICGRIQSREYLKSEQKHIAYEVSVSSIEQ